MRRAVHGELLDPRRQRDGSPNQSASALGGISDLASGLVKHPVIECLQANPYILRFHRRYRQSKEPAPRGNKTGPPDSLERESGGRKFLYYFMICATTPAPTVRPPSRIAKRRPWSIAIGAISFTPSVTLSDRKSVV